MPWRIDFPFAPRLFWKEICVRVICVTFFIVTEDLTPFERIIQPEEQWMYKYPETTPYINTPALYGTTISGAILVVLVFLLLKRNFREAWEGILVPSLSMPMTGLITNIIKLSVGRPRPDFFDRCYPNQKNFDATLPCTGDPHDIMEGKKSFPSGHSSIAFCSFGFISLYLAGQLGVFNSRGRGEGWRLLLSISPIICAILMAISRTCDYHHHWQDVTVGAIIGTLITFVVYRQYFPSPGSSSSDVPYACHGSNQYQNSLPSNSSSVNTPLIRRSVQQSTSGDLIKNV